MTEAKHIPNPLPCGCGAVGIRELDHGEARERFSSIHIKHCRLHAAAPPLYEALEELLAVDDAWHGSVNGEMAGARRKARAALWKARTP